MLYEALPGDKVWLSRAGIRSGKPCEKLSEKKIGPFVIKRQINPVTFELYLPEHLKIHPIFHVSLLAPYVENLIEGRSQPNPPPIVLDDENRPLFEVEQIIDSRIYRRQLQYLIHWKGYAECDRTWEPAKNFIKSATPALIQAIHRFHNTFPDKAGPLLGRDIMS